MIEVNLLPGTEKRKKQRAGFAVKMPAGMPAVDRMTAFIAAAWIIAPLVAAWMFFGVRSERGDLQVAIDQAAADSVRYSRLIETQASLQARQDTIAQKLSIIQEIDAGRYIWPHILDEVSRALPPYTWIETIRHRDSAGRVGFTIIGKTGNLAALTRFMDALESSPFLRGIELISSEQAQLGTNEEPRLVTEFFLNGDYVHPPLDMIETVPLFVDGTMNGGES
jgi:Tfp pilus assembly protein PilN